ncbi:hypothetical protein AAL_05734 [Moelleriella libera RCEF 2490]|uniref:Uncharacterized protein n=1 Tax=Moelleriella libera RCEF 2490 TaxID=1081109 RepID=A0A168A1F8_9HYPO|nr:hypothetical protein AAL_05734 [Moelleriella libera RCEF 2490]
MPSQRPYFLSSFLSAFRQQGPALQTNQQPNKHNQTGSSSATSTATAAASSYTQSSAASRAISTSAAAVAAAAAATASAQANARSPRVTTGIPIPNPSTGRRRGSDSSSEGFKDAIGADKWYIGGRTAAGEERFFKLGVVRRVRSNDGLSLDRLSL